MLSRASVASLPLWPSLALLACILFFDSLSAHSPLEKSFKDSGHLYTFFFFALILRALLNLVFPKITTNKLNTLVLVVAGSAGLLVEIVQPYFGRQLSLVDWMYDLLGVCLALLVPVHSARAFTVKHLFVAIAAILLGNLVPGYYVYAYAQQEKQLPLITGFESLWERNLVMAKEPNEINFETSQRGNRPQSSSAVVTLRGGTHPGIEMEHFWPHWQNFSSLKFEVFNYQRESIALFIRINDAQHNHQYHDRFNHRLIVNPGSNDISIPLELVKQAPATREMNLEEIRKIIIFAQSATPMDEIKFALDNFTLFRSYD